MGYQHIRYDVSGAVAIITLNRPERLNALSPTMRTDLLAALTESDASDYSLRIAGNYATSCWKIAGCWRLQPSCSRTETC